MKYTLSLLLIILFLAILAHRVATAQQPVGPSAAWCKDRTMYPQPGRYRVITVRIGDANEPQECIEVLDTQQSPICRVRFDCEKAT